MKTLTNFDYTESNLQPMKEPCQLFCLGKSHRIRKRRESLRKSLRNFSVMLIDVQIYFGLASGLDKLS